MLTLTAECRAHVYVADHDNDFYAWSCACGARSESRDYLHAAYARDDWRESHGLDPEINFPLV